MATNSTDYNSVVCSLNQPLHSKQFPSYYLMTKHRPELENSTVQLLPKYEHLLTDSSNPTRMVERSNNENDYSSKKLKVSKRYYSRFKGGFAQNIDLLRKKIDSYNLPIDCSDLILFDLFDGANHLETVEGKIDLVSFNSTVINADLISKSHGYSTARTSRILT